jgi:hypothetical protein
MSGLSWRQYYWFLSCGAQRDYLSWLGHWDLAKKEFKKAVAESSSKGKEDTDKPSSDQDK